MGKDRRQAQTVPAESADKAGTGDGITDVLYLGGEETPLLYLPPEEDGANDNEQFRYLLGRQADEEAAKEGLFPRRSEMPQELDFAAPARRRRGFLDEEND